MADQTDNWLTDSMEFINIQTFSPFVLDLHRIGIIGFPLGTAV